MAREPVEQELAMQVKRLQARINLLRKQLNEMAEELDRVRALTEDRTFRLASRVARLEGACHAVQYQDGS